MEPLMRETLTHWQLKDFDPGTGHHAGGDDEGWTPASAPGDTYLALVAAGRLGHPFIARNEAAAAWVTDREWHWRTHFDAAPIAAGERVELVFDGLDTFATIHLNGAKIGSADNMFRDWRYDIGPHLRSDRPNELVVVFTPPALASAGKEIPTWGALSEKIVATRRNVMRKAQFGWGWDWGPNLPTVGIWREVRLERRRSARISDLRATVANLSDLVCELHVALDIDAPDSRPNAAISLRDPDGRTVASTTLAVAKSAATTLTIENPQRWWTADLGAQPLYSLDVELLNEARSLDRREMKLGLRTITLDQSPDPDEPGTTFFRFVLNGVPIFARGACWIPASSFVATVDRAHYRKLLTQSLAANMNMIRVWGGGVYEHDAFYELCDELGLLVWQDFMFACAPYPENEAAFIDSVREEVRYQARRLRHHASLALWCGNNENQMFRFIADTLFGKASPLQGALYYDRLIPEALRELDPVTPYWPGSPWGGPSPNSMRSGDVHDWTVWHGMPPVPDQEFVGTRDISPAGVHYQRYAEDLGRFISEFGIHAAPSLSSLRRWMNADDLKLDAPGFLERIKDEPTNKVDAMLEPVTGLPTTLEDYVDRTMLLQAEGLKFGIEHFRRRKPHCSGTLIWQLNDCWPCVSWSLMGYDGDGKASFYAVTRAYAPVLASFKELGDGCVELWISNDTLAAIEGEAIAELLDLGGGSRWRVAVHYAIAANGSEPVWRGKLPQDTSDVVLHVDSPSGQFATNRLLPSPIKELRLRRASPRYRIRVIGPHELEIDINADAWLLFVMIETPQPGTRYDDNYFDLRVGERKTVRVSNVEHPLSADAVTVRCWNERL